MLAQRTDSRSHVVGVPESRSPERVLGSRGLSGSISTEVLYKRRIFLVDRSEITIDNDYWVPRHWQCPRRLIDIT